MARAVASTSAAKKPASKPTSTKKAISYSGRKTPSGWIRAELRYGNKLRVLPSDMLRRPADHFAGASEWHAALLAEANALAIPQPVPCEKQLAIQTVEAEVTRVIRWVATTAGQSLALFVKYATLDQFAAMVDGLGKPGRLRKFNNHEIASAFNAAAGLVLKGASAGHAFA